MLPGIIPVMNQGPIAIDAATTAWVAAVVANGGTVSAGRKTLVNALIVGGKADGWWAKKDRLWLHAAENTPSALTDLIVNALAVANGSPTFTTDRGYTGVDASPSVYIDTGFNPSTAGGNYTQNAASISIWNANNTAATGGGAAIGISTTVGSNTNIFAPYGGDSNAYGRINDASNSGGMGIPATGQGHWFLNRSGASATQLYQNASLFGSPNGTSGVLSNGNIFILGLAGDGGAASPVGSPKQQAMASIGGNFTSTDVTNFYNRLRTYMTAVGVP